MEINKNNIFLNKHIIIVFILFALLLVLFTTKKAYALSDPSELKYNENENYFQLMIDCINSNTKESLEFGKVYEEYRNYKIDNNELDYDKTNLFSSDEIDVIVDNLIFYQNKEDKRKFDQKRIADQKETQKIMEQVESSDSYVQAKESEHFQQLMLPNIDTSFKAYMPYTAITNRNSLQWKYRQMAYTDNEGFRRINNDYVVALGTYYAKACGERFQITLSSGKVFTVITGDIKADCHTDSSHMYGRSNNNMVEFIVDAGQLNSMSRRMGDVSYSGFEGSVTNICKIY